MAFATIHYFSRSLRKASSFNIVFPEDPAAPRPWAAFYLLHGLSDDNTIWARRTSIERYVEGLPMAVIMPDGGRGWYSNAIEGDAYEDDLVKDVIGLVERTFPVGRRRRPGHRRALHGWIRRRQARAEASRVVRQRQFASGAVRFLPEDVKKYKEYCPEFQRILGKSPAGGPEDPSALVERIDHGRVPSLRLDCGTDVFVRTESCFSPSPRIAPCSARVPGVPRGP